jgi:hypothetical protein
MRRLGATTLTVAVAVLGFAACSKDSTAPASLIDDSQVTADVAASAGQAIVTDVLSLLGNESAGALPTAGVQPSAPIAFGLFGTQGDSVATQRTKTCYDASNAVVANCAPATTRKIAFHVTLDGVRTGTNVTGVVHRVRDWTLTRNFNTASPPVEVSRTHDGVGASHDTLTYANTSTNVTRVHDEVSSDSTVAVTFALPHASNPWPVSGTMIRNVSLHVVVDTPTRHETRDVTKRVEVDYPADAQGNVVMHVNTLTCNLNLTTHAVTGCH